jgi:benzylsuccinate CoA-transferase BbsF subunit
MARCQAAGVPAGVVQDGEDLNTRDPQLARYQFLHKIEDVSPLLGQTWADRLPIRFSQTPCNIYERTKAVGEDNVSVLGDWLGMDEAEVRKAESEGRLQ